MILPGLVAAKAEAMTMSAKLDQLSNILNAEIFVEETIAGVEAGGLPKNAESLSQEDLIRRSLAGYSISTMYKGDKIARLWVYKSGTGKYTRIASRHNPPALKTPPQPALAGKAGPSIKKSAANTLVRPISYDRGVKRSIHGYSYKTNAFGFNTPVLRQDPFPEDLRLASLNNPTTGGMKDVVRNFQTHTQVAKEMEEERNLAQSAMMQRARTQARKK